MMKNTYINTLIRNIENTEIWGGADKLYKDYNDGIDRLVEIFTRHKERGTQLFFIGNGGSAAIASHMTADFMKNGGMNTRSLYDPSVTTCMGNDFGYEYIFSGPLNFFAKENDLVVAISSSGNSQNIINAVEVSKIKCAEIVTFTGFKPDNKIKQMGNMNIYVPCEAYGIVESIHNLILQQIVDILFERDGSRSF